MTSDSRRLVIFGTSNILSDLFDCALAWVRAPCIGTNGHFASVDMACSF